MSYIVGINRCLMAAAGFTALLFATGCVSDLASPVAPETWVSEPAVGSSFAVVQVDAVVTSVSDASARLGGAVIPGQAIYGGYTYDMNVADSHHKGDIGRYVFTTAPAGVSFTVAGLEFRSDPGAVNMTIKLLDNKKTNLIRDSYEVKSVSNLDVTAGVGVASIVLTLEDDTASALSSDALADALVNLGAWSSAVLVISGSSGWRIEASIVGCTPGGDTAPSGRSGGTRKLHPDVSK